MFSKIISVFIAINVIPAVNGFIIDSQLRVLEPILMCFEGNAPEFTGEKAMAARLDLDLAADFLEWSCLTVGVSSETKLMQDKLNKDKLKWDQISLIHPSISSSIHVFNGWSFISSENIDASSIKKGRLYLNGKGVYKLAGNFRKPT